MQPSEKAFDRVRSLLGKLDRSIDDARRRRLTEGEECAPSGHERPVSMTPTNLDHTVGGAPGSTGDETPVPAARPESKYGRARPIRDLSGPSQATWQRA